MYTFVQRNLKYNAFVYDLPPPAKKTTSAIKKTNEWPWNIAAISYPEGIPFLGHFWNVTSTETWYPAKKVCFRRQVTFTNDI